MKLTVSVLAVFSLASLGFAAPVPNPAPAPEPEPGYVRPNTCGNIRILVCGLEGAKGWLCIGGSRGG